MLAVAESSFTLEDVPSLEQGHILMLAPAVFHSPQTSHLYLFWRITAFQPAPCGKTIHSWLVILSRNDKCGTVALPRWTLLSILLLLSIACKALMTNHSPLPSCICGNLWVLCLCLPSAHFHSCKESGVLFVHNQSTCYLCVELWWESRWRLWCSSEKSFDFKGRHPLNSQLNHQAIRVRGLKYLVFL